MRLGLSNFRRAPDLATTADVVKVASDYGFLEVMEAYAVNRFGCPLADLEGAERKEISDLLFAMVAFVDLKTAGRGPLQ